MKSNPLTESDSTTLPRQKAPVLTASDFDLSIQSTQQPVLIDFYADWCGPCKMISPLIEELSSEFRGKALVAKLNVDESPAIAARYGVSSIPTLILFKEGRPIRTFRGVTSKTILSASLESAA